MYQPLLYSKRVFHSKLFFDGPSIVEYLEFDDQYLIYLDNTFDYEFGLHHCF